MLLRVDVQLSVRHHRCSREHHQTLIGSRAAMCKARFKRTLKLVKLNLSAQILVKFGDHARQFAVGGIMAEGAHDGAEVVGGDATIAI